MARTLDELVREALGAQLLSILQLQAQNEALTDKVAALSLPASPPVSAGETS